MQHLAGTGNRLLQQTYVSAGAKLPKTPSNSPHPDRIGVTKPLVWRRWPLCCEEGRERDSRHALARPLHHRHRWDHRLRPQDHLQMAHPGGAAMLWAARPTAQQARCVHERLIGDLGDKHQGRIHRWHLSSQETRPSSAARPDPLLPPRNGPLTDRRVDLAGIVAETATRRALCSGLARPCARRPTFR